jgi:hypothetical protein
MVPAFFASATIITPLPYEIATSTGSEIQSDTWGNMIMPGDVSFHEFGVETEGISFSVPICALEGEASTETFHILAEYWNNSGCEAGCTLADSDFVEVNSIPTCGSDPEQNVAFVEVDFATSTFTTADNYQFRLYGDLFGVQTMYHYKMITSGGTQPVPTAHTIADFGAPPPSGATLTWNNPENGRTYLPTLNWGLFSWFDVPISDFDTFTIYISLSTSSDPANAFLLSDGWSGSHATGAQLGANGTAGAVWGAHEFLISLSTSTLIYGKATLFGFGATSSEVIASSSISWTFLAQTIYGEGYATSTDPCDPGANFILFGLCRLFLPSQGGFYQFQALKTDLESKPPFGYFSSFSEVIHTLSTSTTSTIPFPNLSLLEAPLFSYIKTGTSWLLWLLFTFWGFGRFRHFQL